MRAYARGCRSRSQDRDSVGTACRSSRNTLRTWAISVEAVRHADENRRLVVVVRYRGRRCRALDLIAEATIDAGQRCDRRADCQADGALLRRSLVAMRIRA